MESVPFFTPILSSNYRHLLWCTAEELLAFGGESVVINTFSDWSMRAYVGSRENSGWGIALKVIVLMTVIFPLIAIVVKVVNRSFYTVFVDAGKTKENPLVLHDIDCELSEISPSYLEGIAHIKIDRDLLQFVMHVGEKGNAYSVSRGNKDVINTLLNLPKLESVRLSDSILEDIGSLDLLGLGISAADKQKFVKLVLNGTDQEESRQKLMEDCMCLGICVDMLVQEGIDLKRVDSLGNTLLHKTTSAEVAKLLIDGSVDVKALNHDLQTPLHTTKCVEVARLLIEKESDIRALDSKGRTPLHKVQNTEIAREILSRWEGPIDMEDSDGRMPFFRDRVGGAKLLIEREGVIKYIINKVIAGPILTVNLYFLFDKVIGNFTDVGKELVKEIEVTQFDLEHGIGVIHTLVVRLKNVIHGCLKLEKVLVRNAAMVRMINDCCDQQLNYIRSRSDFPIKQMVEEEKIYRQLRELLVVAS